MYKLNKFNNTEKKVYAQFLFLENYIPLISTFIMTFNEFLRTSKLRNVEKNYPPSSHDKLDNFMIGGVVIFFFIEILYLIPFHLFFTFGNLLFLVINK